MNNAVLKAIKNRRSCRAYTSKPVTDEQLNLLTSAAVQAPTGANAQQVHVVVVKDRAVLDEMEQEIVSILQATKNESMLKKLSVSNNKAFYGAPVVIFLAIGNKVTPQIDAGICVQTIALAAESIGLGSVILASPGMLFAIDRAGYWKKKLKFPDGFTFGVAIAVGEAADSGIPHIPDNGKITVI